MLLSAPVYAASVKVIVSIYPLYDITRQIGKDKVTVNTLLPAGASPHTFEPTPKQMAELSNADVFIKMGAGLEFWAEKIVKSISSRKIVIADMSKDMPLIYGVGGHEHEHKHEHGHKGDDPDPHFWLDPLLAKKIADSIAETLIKVDPANRLFFLDNAKSYKAELERLNQEISKKASTFRTKEYVTFHSAWNYFSRRYGLRVAGVIEEAPGREPGPQNISRLIKELRRLKARTIFAEPQFSPRVAEAIAKEAGATVLLLDPLGAPNLPDRDTYLKLMRYNLSQMERAMK